MNVFDLMIRDVQTCRPTDSMNRAARIMWERDCGCVPVADASGRVVGMITDRDIAMAAYTKDAPLSALPIEGSMARELAKCHPGDSLDTALHLMAERQIHRLPVVDDAGKLVGVLSLTDVVQGTAKADDRTRRAFAQPVLSALLDVTRPRMAERAMEQVGTRRQEPKTARAHA